MCAGNRGLQNKDTFSKSDPICIVSLKNVSCGGKLQEWSLAGVKEAGEGLLRVGCWWWKRRGDMAGKN
jgi:hypothetical protein